MNAPFQRFYEIDLLRFLAALAVVLFHYAFRGFAADDMSVLTFPMLGEVFRYGYLGVELFFIISGFVILMTASNTNPTGFVISRISRLYPAFWLAVTLTYAVIVLWGAPRFDATFSQYIYNLSMISGYVYIPHIDEVYWTLLVEMKFYFLVFIILVVRQIKHIKYFLTLWLAYSWLAQFIEFDSYTHFFLFPHYASCFIGGAIFYLIRTQGISVDKAVLLVAAMALSLWVGFKDAVDMQQQYAVAYSPSIVAGIILSFYLLFGWISLKGIKGLQHPLVVTVGALTYPLYLIHQNIGFIAFNRLAGSMNRYLLLLATVIVMLIAAYIIQRYVEKPVSRWMKRLLRAMAARLWIPEKRTESSEIRCRG